MVEGGLVGGGWGLKREMMLTYLNLEVGEENQKGERGSNKFHVGETMKANEIAG